MTANQGSTTMRNVPDVALTANNVYVRADGYDYNVGGTSCASPLWAGFMALVNQQAVGTGKATVGFINPLVYAIGASPNYPSAFHDITTGNNTRSGSPTKFFAVASYDLCTGWGTPAGQNLINALVNPEPLIITPSTGFSSIGGAGGPFTVTSQSLTLTNAGTNMLTWSLSNTSAWLNASPSNGMLTPGGPAVPVTVSLNSAASNLVVGTYSATLWFTNLNDGIGQSRQFNLSVISPPTITMQPTNQAVIEGTAASFTVSATGGLPLAYQWQDNGTNLTDGGDISGSATTNLVITDVSDADVGIYTVTVTNLAGSTVSSNASLTIMPSPPIITVQPASQIAVAGTTATFTVGAIGSTPFFYQWSCNDTNIGGATNATLTLPNVQFDQAGAYDVVITNLHGSATSSNAILTVVNVPVITSFSPVLGNVGTVVNVNGLNFSSTPNDNIVYVGAVQAVVSAASATNLTVTVPAGATYGPITETVNGLVAYSSGVFEPTFSGNGLNIGPSTFAARQDIPTPSGPIACAVGDLNGDGKLDVVVANSGAGSISIFQNIGSGGLLGTNTFGPPINLPTGGSPRSVTVADVDGDGKLDILVPDTGLSQILIYRNISTGGLLTSNSFAAPVALNVGSDTRNVRVCDLTGDGRPDIISVSHGNNVVSIFKNIGTAGSLTTNSFGPRVDLTCAGGALNVVVGDLDGDGKPDLAVIDNSVSYLSLFRNISTPGVMGTNSFAPRVDLPALESNQGLAAADLEGDGKLDLVTGSSSGSTYVSVYHNQATPGSLTINSFAAPVNFAMPGWVHDLAVGDLNGDGKPDILSTEQSSDLLSLFQNQSGPGGFTNSSLGARVDLAVIANPWGECVADLEGDGRPAIIFANQFSSYFSIYQNLTPFGGPPVITQQPTNQTVASGNAAMFSVAATGSTPLSYQWNFEGTNILEATNTTLILTNVQLSQSGSYAVLVTNTLGSVLSSNAFFSRRAFATNHNQPTSQPYEQCGHNRNFQRNGRRIIAAQLSMAQKQLSHDGWRKCLRLGDRELDPDQRPGLGRGWLYRGYNQCRGQRHQYSHVLPQPHEAKLTVCSSSKMKARLAAVCEAMCVS